MYVARLDWATGTLPKKNSNKFKYKFYLQLALPIERNKCIRPIVIRLRMITLHRHNMI